MTSELLKPLAVFSRHSQSKPYINSIKNLSDARRTLTEESYTESDRTTIIKTTFDLILQITTEPGGLAVEITTINAPAPTPELQTPPRHYRIFPEYGTNFLWRAVEDIRDNEQGYTEPDEELNSFPTCVRELYSAWVDEWSYNWKKQCDDTQDYYASVFLERSEEVAWNIAGYLLAWCIALGPGVGSVEYSPVSTKYLLVRGNESAVTERFLEDQIGILAEVS